MGCAYQVKPDTGKAKLLNISGELGGAPREQRRGHAGEASPMGFRGFRGSGFRARVQLGFRV